ncbi:hypothetical protein ACX80W_11310 [Arthrobacter sp. TMN-37]
MRPLRDQLSRANGRLYGVELITNQFIGPPLGGLLVALGVAAGFAVPASPCRRHCGWWPPVACS